MSKRTDATEMQVMRQVHCGNLGFRMDNTGTEILAKSARKLANASGQDVLVQIPISDLTVAPHPRLPTVR